jgi:hypothetical protein
VSGLNLWWARNDGMTGHVWLSVRDLALLREEMAAHGMDLEIAEGEIPAGEIARALESADPEARSLEDEKLWRDWLVFLEGAAVNGGLRIR